MSAFASSFLKLSLLRGLIRKNESKGFSLVLRHKFVLRDSTARIVKFASKTHQVQPLLRAPLVTI